MINIREINFWNTKKILYYLCFVSFRECQKFRQLVYLVYFMINFVNSIENEISFWRIFLIVIFFFRGGNYRIVIFEFGISVHEKLRHFIIVMENYSKNDGNQNINGFNKVHEKIFRQINFLVISLVKPLFWRNFCQKSVRVKFRFFHSVWHVNCGNFGILLPRFFSQNFRQINVLLNNFAIIWFDGKNLRGSEIFVFPNRTV